MRERILNTIKEMDDNEIMYLWNEYCRESGRYDDEILDADTLEEMINNSSEGALFWINRFFYGHDELDENSSANPNRDFFAFNGYGNIISFSYIYNSYTDTFYNMDIDSLVDYIVENNDSLYNDDIQEILDEMEESEEV